MSVQELRSTSMLLGEIKDEKRNLMIQLIHEMFGLVYSSLVKFGQSWLGLVKCLWFSLVKLVVILLIFFLVWSIHRQINKQTDWSIELLRN